jgi:cysteine synthase
MEDIMVDWSDPLLCQMPEPIAEIDMGTYSIPVIPVPRRPMWTGFYDTKAEGYGLACYAVRPNGKRVPAQFMLDMAVKTGLVKRGGIIVELTSGGMGAALAYCAKPYEITAYTIVSDDMPQGKILPQTRLGAIVKTKSEVLRELGLDHNPGTFVLAQLYAEKLGGVFLNQYFNEWNPMSWQVVASKVFDIFGGALTEAFIDLGSTGGLRGIGTELKKLDPKIQIIATHPYFKRKIAGLRGPERLNLNEVAPWQHVPDYTEAIDERTARKYSEELFSFAGIAAGESGGAAFGMADHYYSGLAARDELNERHVGIMRFMDTFVPYAVHS